MELAKLGYYCTGIDLSSEMIEIAEKNNTSAAQKAVFSVADVRTYVPDKKYDAVISLFHVMSYQNRNKDILAAFSSVRSALEKGAYFYLTVGMVREC